jgi:hypothetical protein
MWHTGLFDVMSCQEAVDWIRRRFKLRRLPSTPPTTARAAPSTAVPGTTASPPGSPTVAISTPPISTTTTTASSSTTNTTPATVETKGHGRSPSLPPSSIRRAPLEVIDINSIASATWKSMADDLCRYAIQKGSKDNVTVMIITLEYRQLAPSVPTKEQPGWTVHTPATTQVPPASSASSASSNNNTQTSISNTSASGPSVARSSATTTPPVSVPSSLTPSTATTKDATPPNLSSSSSINTTSSPPSNGTATDTIKPVTPATDQP